jgi:hypothetical protein
MYSTLYSNCKKINYQKMRQDTINQIIGFSIENFPTVFVLKYIEYHYLTAYLEHGTVGGLRGSMGRLERRPSTTVVMPQHGWVQCCVPAAGVDSSSQLGSPSSSWARRPIRADSLAFGFSLATLSKFNKIVSYIIYFFV